MAGFFLWKDEEIKLSSGLLFFIFMIHLLYWLAPAILEDDYFRYAWDGRSIRLGVHPYAQSPSDMMLDSDSYPGYADSINYPWLRTIYPPLAELAFCSELLFPDRILGWRVFILLIDIALFALIVNGVKEKLLSSKTAFVILLNPLLLKETLNSQHYDALTVLILVAFLLKFRQNKDSLSGALLFGILCGLRPWYLALSLWLFPQWKVKQYICALSACVIPWIVMLSLPGSPPLNEAFSSWHEFIATWEFNALGFALLNIVNSENARLLAWVCGFTSLFFVFYKTHKDLSLYGGLISLLAWIFWQPTVNAWYLMPMIVGLAICREQYKIFYALSAFASLAYLSYI